MSISNKINQFRDDTNSYPSPRVTTAHVTYYNYTRVIGVIYETGDIDLQFDIVFASYYSNIYYGSDGETNVAFEITFDIT